MVSRTVSALRAALLACAVAAPSFAHAQVAARTAFPERAVRHDIPMTNAIQRAFASGARDSTGRPGRNYAQLRTDYTINARLDPSTQRINGRETIVIHNNTRDSLTQIVMRLDQNLFIFQSPHAAPWVPAEETGGFIITKLTVNGQAVNMNPAPGGRGGRGGPPPRATENSLLTGRSTHATIALLNPVPAHGQATLEVEWNHKVPGGPGLNHRMTQRWADTLFQPTQWYPRVAVYDDLRGWDPELYLGPSEFYNNFGKFDVSIDVPAGWVVGGTGLLQNPQEVLTTAARERLTHVLASDNDEMIVAPPVVGAGQATASPSSGDRLVWHFVADTVNDFAWVTAKKLVWKATRANIPTKGFIPVNMYYLVGDSSLYTNAGPIARHALEFYSKLWFPYSFPQLTLQDGPSAGMEYPMVINANQGAADHETFHQWAPMTMSNNETWYGWMDEGFNQYSNILSAADRQGTQPDLDRRGQSYGATSGDEAEPPMMWDANYAGPPFYGFTTYNKTPLMLSMLGGIVGDTAVWHANSEFGKTWSYKHPSPWDYMFFMNNALKRDLGWFWYYWLFTTDRVDGSIQNVTTAGSTTHVTIHEDGQMPSPVILKVQFAASGPAIKPMANAKMVDATTAIVTWPVDVWFSGSKTFVANLNFGGRKIEKILFDPGCRFPDKNPSDNMWPRSTLANEAPAGRQGIGAARTSCGN
jgi:hypothetical protein